MTAIDYQHPRKYYIYGSVSFHRLLRLTCCAVNIGAIVRDSSFVYSVPPVVQLAAVHPPLQQAHFGGPDCSHHG